MPDRRDVAPRGPAEPVTGDPVLLPFRAYAGDDPEGLEAHERGQLAAALVFMRKQAGLTQAEVGQKLRVATSTVCLAEDPANERLTVRTVSRLAAAAGYRFEPRFYRLPKASRPGKSPSASQE